MGLSGGPDSVFLLHKLLEFKKNNNLNIILAHLDHEWQDKSYLASEFCEKLANKYKLKLISKTISDLNLELNLNLKSNGSKEELARNYRKLFFESLAKEYNAKYIVLAHHLDDQIENFLIRLTRGTSLAGLTGIKELEKISNKNIFYFRPLLNLDKDFILNYLKNNNFKYFLDITNSSQEFLRNRIRTKVTPELYSCDKRFKQNFLRTLTKLQSTEDYLNNYINNLSKDIIINNNINLTKFLSLDSFIQDKLLLNWLYSNNLNFNLSESFLIELKRFINFRHINNKSQHKVNNSWSLIKDNNFLKLNFIFY